MLVWSAAAQTPSAVPRMPDGHPDLSGVWWRGADVGGRPATPAPGRGAAPAGKQAPAAGKQAGKQAPPVTFAGLYVPSAQAKAKTLGDKDDPTLRCVPTAFGTLNVSLYDVGAVGQIIATPKFVVMLTETYHGFRLVPTDGRPHRDNVPPVYRGDSVGHWDGDTLVVDVAGFNDKTWLPGRGGSMHSDQLHVVERYRHNGETISYEATMVDPKVFTKPFVYTTTLKKSAPGDRVMEYECLENNVDIPHLVGR